MNEVQISLRIDEDGSNSIEIMGCVSSICVKGYTGGATWQSQARTYPVPAECFGAWTKFADAYRKFDPQQKGYRLGNADANGDRVVRFVDWVIDLKDDAAGPAELPLNHVLLLFKKFCICAQIQVDLCAPVNMSGLFNLLSKLVSADANLASTTAIP